MDNKRLIVAMVLSVAILAVFQWVMPHPKPHQTAKQVEASSTTATPPGAVPGAVQDASGANPAAIAAPPAADIRIPIDAPRVHGSINLVGGRLDDLVLKDYHETVKADSPLVRVLEPGSEKQPNFIQFGWSTPGGLAVPDSRTVWKADGAALSPGHPLTLSWDNGAGLVFHIIYSIDENYMFGVDQQVENHTANPVSVFPWSRVARLYAPVDASGGFLVGGDEGAIGIFDGRLQQKDYKGLAKDADAHGGVAFSAGDTGGWAGINDKYWLTALLPDSPVPMTGSFRHIAGEGEHAAGTYQVDFTTRTPLTAAPGASARFISHAFAGAKEVHLLDTYQAQLHVADFWKAVDFGWFAFLTRPIFFVLDWLNTLLGNFGLALMGFTLIVKALFFPLANKQFRSMSKMKLIAPKIAAVRERFKDDPARQQQEMLGVYRTEKINPVSGCLPMLVQIPVFWCLYKVLYGTIEMRHAPFFGWIHDLSAPDPTNVFNLFGLIPIDPTQYVSALHLGVWPIVLGGTMFAMQKLNPPPPDPMQARIFMLMPVIFAYFMAAQPAGLVIYYCWNNLLTAVQQWFIQKRVAGEGTAVRSAPAKG